MQVLSTMPVIYYVLCFIMYFLTVLDVLFVFYGMLVALPFAWCTRVLNE